MNSSEFMLGWDLQTARGKPARGIVAEEIAAVTPKFIKECRSPPRAMKGKLYISADQGTFQRQLSRLLPELGCERAPIAIGHDFQLPIERSFARAKDSARLKLNMSTSDLSKEQIGRILKESWCDANDLRTIQAEIMKMPTVWHLIVESGGEYVTKAMLDAELKRKRE